MHKNKLLVLVFIILLFPIIHAHLDAGHDEVINGYLSDFGYSPENPSVSETTFLSFNLVNDSTKEVINITSVWLRISSSSEIVFSGELNAKNGNALLNYKFPYKDNYEIKIQFKQNDEIILETNVMIKITSNNNIKYLILIILGLISISIFLMRNKIKKK